MHRWYATLIQITEKALSTASARVWTAFGGRLEELWQDCRSSFFHEKRGKLKGSGGDALEFWNSQAEARADTYPGFSAKNTGKMRGMMSNLLMELKGEDSPEEATRKIRDYLEDVIENWHRFAGSTIYEQKYGTPKRVPKTPSFEFLYTFRAEMKAKLADRKISMKEIDLNALEKIED